MKTSMSKDRTGLWLPKMFNFNRKHHAPIVRTVTLPSGERAKVTICDARTTRHIETDERIDAVVTPRPVKAALVTKSPAEELRRLLSPSRRRT